MSDSDMDIDDDEVQVQVQQHTIAGESGLLARSIEASDSQNDVNMHSDEQSKIIKDSIGNSQPNIPGKSGKNIMLEGEKGTLLSRFPAPPQSFPLWNGPEQKRPALPCKFFAQGWCAKGDSCRFLHVNEITNRTSQQQAEINMAGTSGIQSVEERRTLESKEGGRLSLLGQNGVTSLVHPSGGQRVFPFTNEMRFMPSLDRRGSLQKCGAVFTENRPVFVNSISSFPLRSSFVQEHGSSITSYRQTDMGSSITSYKQTDMRSSGSAWTGSVFSSVPMNQYASPLGHFENRNNLNGSGSLPMVQAISVSSGLDAEVDTTSDKKKVSSNDWEPSEPFRASFTIPPYILPSSDTLYDFTDLKNPDDRSLNAPSPSKGKDAQKKSGQQKDGDSTSGPQARDCNNDDKNSSCSQNQYQKTVAMNNLEEHGVVEGVATSVVDQNDATTPSKEISSSVAAETRVVLKRSKPAGHESWHRSDGSSHKKVLKLDEIDGEVRSDAGTKVMRQFRTAVVETIKEMLKPLWREGRLTKDVHNMVVKRATEKIVSAAVQFHQVPTDTESIEQYLSLSAPKIVKLVEGYVEKYGKP